MTTANFNALADWVDGLTFDGIKTRSLRTVQQMVNPQDCPLLMPELNDPDYITDMEFERLSFRHAVDGRRRKLVYRAHYALYYRPVALGVTLFEFFPGMVDAVTEVINTIVSNETPDGAHDIRPDGMVKFGAVTDIEGTLFHGARLRFLVTEFS